MGSFSIFAVILALLLVLRHHDIAQLNVVRIGDNGVDQSEVKVPGNYCIKVYV